LGLGEGGGVVSAGELAVEFEAEHREIGLDQSAAFGDVLGGLHLVPCQHPYLNICVMLCILALRRSRMVSGTSS
jgi:hypothetical protein